MLWFNKTIGSGLRSLAIISFIFAGLSACQVRPLYDSTSVAELAAISISDARNADEQDVRNELIFLLAGGHGEPAAPEYKLTLSVSSATAGVVYDSALSSNIAARVTMTAKYSLQKLSEQNVLGSGTKNVTALIDDLDQDFARLRAIRDAKQRAGRELAEFIRADLAIMLSRQNQ